MKLNPHHERTPGFRFAMWFRLLFLISAPSSSHAQVFERISTFGAVDNVNKGQSPNPLVQGTDGNFYGTTRNGGGFGSGTVFRMTPSGILTTLVEFTHTGTLNTGGEPRCSLAQFGDGTLYGTTYLGGANNLGTVFRVTPSGVLTTLVEFTGQGSFNQGSQPSGALVVGHDGNLYGTTEQGGVFNLGTVFRMTPSGVLSTLVEFKGMASSPKGSAPSSGVILGIDGNFYGTSRSGGADDYGTVFRMTPSGVLTTLVEFTGNGEFNKGRRPTGSLVQGADGYFYGTTESGGASNFGTVFKMSPSGELIINPALKYTRLHTEYACRKSIS